MQPSVPVTLMFQLVKLAFHLLLSPVEQPVNQVLSDYTISTGAPTQYYALIRSFQISDMRHWIVQSHTPPAKYLVCQPSTKVQFCNIIISILLEVFTNTQNCQYWYYHHPPVSPHRHPMWPLSIMDWYSLYRAPSPAWLCCPSGHWIPLYNPLFLPLPPCTDI